MNKYTYKLETHAHTIHNSHCAETTPAKVAEVYASKGYNGIICTNHFNTHDTLYLKKQYGAKDDCDVMELYLRDFYELKKCGARVGLDVFCGAEISPDCTTYYKDNPIPKYCTGTDCRFLKRTSADFLNGVTQTGRFWSRRTLTVKYALRAIRSISTARRRQTFILSTTRKTVKRCAFVNTIT